MSVAPRSRIVREEPELSGVGLGNFWDVTDIHKAAVLSWDQRSLMGGGKPAQQANKISAVKRKGNDPNFQQQQQGDANADGKGKKTRRGKKKTKSQDGHAHIASAAITTTVVDTPAAMDPRKDAHISPQLYQGQSGALSYPIPTPIWSSPILEAFTLAERLDIHPSIETIQCLDREKRKVNKIPLQNLMWDAETFGCPSGIVEISSNDDSDAPAAPAPKRGRCSHKRAIDPPPQSSWDSEDMVDVYSSEVDQDIANAAFHSDDEDFPRMLPRSPRMIRQVDSSIAPS
ncbi:hypothetical protein EV363DRAFT_1443666 [Boletus edulis]|nr:hypothetical protein EV363DRAFT_1443666 [Boletus edulis]